MGLGVGQRQYSAPEPDADLRSLSAKRAKLIAWHRLHPDFDRLYKRADAAIDWTNEKVRAYNVTKERLDARIALASDGCRTIRLVASRKHVANLEAAAKMQIPLQIKARNNLANRIYEWANLPLLDEQIAQSRRQRLG